MSRRKNIKSKQQFENALALERSGDLTAALKLYKKAVTTDPANSHAWNRQMVLYRKTRSKEEEVTLIKLALAKYQQSLEVKQEEWLNANKEKANRTRELAQVLGLLETTGLPKNDYSIIEKWETRLHLLAYRIKSTRKKKPRQNK